MKKFFLVFLFIGGFLSSVHSKNYIEKDGVKYLPNKILVKFKTLEDVSNLSSELLSKKLKSDSQISLKSVKQKFFAKRKTSERFKLIHEIELNGPHDPSYISKKLSKLPGIAWAEPEMIHELAFVPNDPSYSQQYALTNVQAEAAWDITKGSAEIIIAINDTGVDWDHPDLAANIWINEAEANGTSGVDDDNNGFIDDIRGWDFGGLSGIQDNDPKEDKPDHGTHVAGIAAAVTNNGTGVAGIGFNCKIMPVKTSQDNIRNDQGVALISHGYKGILYAVDSGADIINCSWGGYGFQQAAQEVIDYAVANGVLVVGAAGNEGRREAIYPGKYEGALSVGYSNQSDRRDGSSNYGESVDLFAPGARIFNTWQDDTYVTLYGSSMAAPLVSGIAGLVKSIFPTYTPLQIAEQVRVNADNIDAQNPGFGLLLGSGRVNAFNAVSNSNAISVRADDVRFIDMGDGDGVFESGERIDVEVDFTNYLSATSNLSVQMISNSNQVTFNTASLNFGSKGTLESFNNLSNKFSFTISETAQVSLDVRFRLDFTDGSYNDFQWTREITINPLYKTTSINDIAVTISSDGKIGFNDYPDNSQGDGFIFRDGTNLLFEGGLMYGNSSSKILSSVRSSDEQVSSDEFTVVEPFIVSSPGDIADEQGHAIFTDAAQGSKRLNIETELNTYSFADSDGSDFIILEYIFKNTSNQSISNFYSGLFFDWDIDEPNYDSNIGRYDNEGKFGYAVNNNLLQISTHAAAALLTEGTHGFYTMSNPDLIHDGFTDAEKWTTLSSGTANASGGPADISTVSSVGPLVINGNESIKVAFSLSAAESLQDLRDAVSRSRTKYSQILSDVNDENITPLTFNLAQNYPNPFNPSTTIEYNIPVEAVSGVEEQNVKLKIYDMLGRKIATLVDEQKRPGKYSIAWDASSVSRRIASGIYFYELSVQSQESRTKIIRKKMVLLK